MPRRKPLQWYIMTSPATDAPTKQFFAEQQHFGLMPEQIHFFQQVHQLAPLTMHRPGSSTPQHIKVFILAETLYLGGDVRLDSF